MMRHRLILGNFAFCVGALGLLAACFLAAELAQAETININVTTHRNAGEGVSPTNLNGNAAGPTIAPASYSGDTWNDILNVPNGTDLLDSTGVAGIVDVALTPGTGLQNQPNGWADSLVPLDMLKNYSSMRKTSATAANNISTLTFSDLGTSPWDIYIVSQGDGNGQGASFKIGADVRTSLGDTAGALGTAFIEGRNYVKFSSVSPVAGAIAVEFGPDGVFADESATGWHAINGIQLVRIPEPTTGVLAMLSLLAMAAFGRRNK